MGKATQVPEMFVRITGEELHDLGPEGVVVGAELVGEGDDLLVLVVEHVVVEDRVVEIQLLTNMSD